MNECKFVHTERAGLYIMVFIIMMTVCDMKNEVAYLKRQVNEIHTVTVEE